MIAPVEVVPLQRVYVLLWAYTVHQTRCRHCVGLVQPVTAASMAMAASAAVALSISAAVKLEHPVATPSRLTIAAAAVSLTTMPLWWLTDDGPDMLATVLHVNLTMEHDPPLATRYFVFSELRSGRFTHPTRRLCLE